MINKDTLNVMEQILRFLKNDDGSDTDNLSMGNNFTDICISVYEDKDSSDDDRALVCKLLEGFMFDYCTNKVRHCLENRDYFNMSKYYGLWEKSIALVARRSFPRFVEYIETDFPDKYKVYGNRKKALYPFVYYLNKAYYDDNLRYIEASFPPSYGKTYLLNLYSCWLFGQNPNNSILRLSYNQELVLAASRMIKQFVNSPRFADVFPYYRQFKGKCFGKEKESDLIIRGSNAATSHIARTRDGGVTGVRANKAIIFDDMTKGAEEATNTSLHELIYTKWSTEWRNRCSNDKVKFIFCGTMWTPDDILNRIIADIEKRTELVEPDIKEFKDYVKVAKDGTAVVIRMPLLDSKDETTCPQVMSTKEALELRDNTDTFSFSCVYQQMPIAPTGLEFANSELLHFDNFPRNEHGDYTTFNYSLAVLDPARKGKDNVSMPIMKSDGTYYYMYDCIFEQKAMTQLYDLIVDKIRKDNIAKLVIENNTDTSLKALLEAKMQTKGVSNCEIIEKYNTKNKESRIRDMRGIIKEKIKFLDKDEYTRNSDYGRFMENLNTYSFDYANKHDDAPDSLALFADQIIMGNAIKPRPRGISRASLGI